MNPLQKKLGILGGGQLGKMLLTECQRLDIDTYILDPDAKAPCAAWCKNFTQGDFRDYETVLAFGQGKDVITIEIEQVNTAALKKLEESGIEVHPRPLILEIIQDKGLQKQFYATHEIATMPFRLFDNAKQVSEAIENDTLKLPFVQKTRALGYDGKGVLVVNTVNDLKSLFDEPCLIEQKANIKKELSVIVAKDDSETKAFDPVEMVFHPTANLVEFLQAPANISAEKNKEAVELAIRTLNAFDIKGVLAVEMFLDQDDNLYVNEVAPRPHNSGHQGIEANYTSQYEQHLRSILGLPLGETKIIQPSVMINLLGEDGYSGKVKILGTESCLSLAGVYIHLYGKKETRPFRKMGHVTVTADTIEEAIEKARFVQKHLRIIAEEAAL